MHVSTGDILREAVKNQTPIGKRAEEFMKRGELVPDEIVVGIIEERFRQDPPTRGFVLDGFPRTLGQARALDAMMWKFRSAIDRVFYFDAPEEVVVERLAGRRTCRKCGWVFHLKFNPPKRAGVCDQCGGELFQRPDDNETTVRERLRVYKEQTAALIQYYDEKQILTRIDGSGSADEVYAQLEKALGT